MLLLMLLMLLVVAKLLLRECTALLLAVEPCCVQGAPEPDSSLRSFAATVLLGSRLDLGDGVNALLSTLFRALFLDLATTGGSGTSCSLRC